MFPAFDVKMHYISPKLKWIFMIKLKIIHDVSILYVVLILTASSKWYTLIIAVAFWYIFYVHDVHYTRKR